MGTLTEDLSAIKTIETGLVNNKVANFAYTDTAYTNNTVNGTPTYDPNAQNNIPTADPSVLKVNSTVLQRGWRAKASAITRMLMNHFLGRISYNLNKLNDNMKSLLDTLDLHYGTANGYATLDNNGRIPYSQLPESALEYKGDWDASTNTPTLADGNGDPGDMYIVSVAGTQNLGSGSIDFIENDRVIYNGSVWQKLSGGSVRSVNSVTPDGTGNISVSGDDILTTPSVSADLQVTLKDKTIRQVHCKGQAGDQMKMLLGTVPRTYSSVFLLTFDTDNTYNNGVIELVFSGGALAGEVLETEYNGAVTSSTNYSIKAGTYIARLVQRVGAPNNARVAIEGEYCVDSAREAQNSDTTFAHPVLCSTSGASSDKTLTRVNPVTGATVAYVPVEQAGFAFTVKFSKANTGLSPNFVFIVDGTAHPYRIYMNGTRLNNSNTGRYTSWVVGTVYKAEILKAYDPDASSSDRKAGVINITPVVNVDATLSSLKYKTMLTNADGSQIVTGHVVLNGLLIQWARYKPASSGGSTMQVVEIPFDVTFAEVFSISANSELAGVDSNNCQIVGWYTDRVKVYVNYFAYVFIIAIGTAPLPDPVPIPFV